MSYDYEHTVLWHRQSDMEVVHDFNCNTAVVETPTTHTTLFTNLVVQNREKKRELAFKFTYYSDITACDCTEDP